jgi:hypothetical protein
MTEYSDQSNQMNVLFSLRHKLLTLEGRYDGLKFVNVHRNEDLQIEDKAKELETLLGGSGEQFIKSENSRLYHKSYLALLKDYLKRAEEHNTSKIDHEYGLGSVQPQSPFQNLLFSEGQTNAFRFAVECEGNLSILRSKLQEEEYLISESLSRNPQGSMSQNASPRSNKNGFIAGLKEAIEIVVVT